MRPPDLVLKTMHPLSLEGLIWGGLLLMIEGIIPPCEKLRIGKSRSRIRRVLKVPVFELGW